MSVFGFSTEPSTGSGDFMPIVKYDARAGRMFRVDRVNDGSGWNASSEDVTSGFKAVFDFENLQAGWMDFSTGGAPVFAVAPIGAPIPTKPTPAAKNGVKFVIKLSKEAAGDQPAVREVSSSAKAFLSGIEEVYTAYKTEAAANAGKLPIIAMEKTTPIKSGTGDKTSTNYRPTFKIVGWAARGDIPVPGTTPSTETASSPPSTGATQVSAPAPAATAELADADDFG